MRQDQMESLPPDLPVPIDDLIIRDGRIEHVLYPVFPSDRDADQVLGWLAAHPT